MAQLQAEGFGSVFVSGEEIFTLEDLGIMFVNICRGQDVTWESIKSHKADKFLLFSNASVASGDFKIIC